ncbi:hypothetical protein ACFLUA_02445 [Chloroflexota bacterium]
MHIDVFQNVPDLMICFPIILIFYQVDFFLLDRIYESFDMTILPGYSKIRHADVHMNILQYVDIFTGCVL